MAETRRNFDQALGNWVNAGKRRGGDGSGALHEDGRAEMAARAAPGLEPLPPRNW